MRNWQDKFFEGRRIGSDDDTGAEMLNLNAVARAFDLRYECISDIKNLKKRYQTDNEYTRICLL